MEYMLETFSKSCITLCPPAKNTQPRTLISLKEQKQKNIYESHHSTPHIPTLVLNVPSYLHYLKQEDADYDYQAVTAADVNYNQFYLKRLSPSNYIFPPLPIHVCLLFYYCYPHLLILHLCHILWFCIIVWSCSFEMIKLHNSIVNPVKHVVFKSVYKL